MPSPDGGTATDGRPRIAVAGGSIGGLCAGLALHGAGFDVQVYEQFSGPMETRGAGIVVQPDLVQLLRNNGAARLPTTGCQVRRWRPRRAHGGTWQARPLSRRRSRLQMAVNRHLLAGVASHLPRQESVGGESKCREPCLHLGILPALVHEARFQPESVLVERHCLGHIRNVEDGMAKPLTLVPSQA